MGSSERRRLARAGKQRQQKILLNVMPSASNTAYKTVGGIAPELFRIPAVRASALLSGAHSPVVAGSSLDTLTHPETLSEESEVSASISDTSEDCNVIMEVAENSSVATSFRSLPGFDSNFSFERVCAATLSNVDEQAIEYTSPTQAKQGECFNELSFPLSCRIGVVFDKTVFGDPSLAYLNFAGGVTASRHIISIFECFTVSCNKHSIPTPTSPVVLSSANKELELLQNASLRVIVQFGPAPPAPASVLPSTSGLTNELSRLLFLGQQINSFSAKIGAWTRSEAVRVHQTHAEQLHLECPASTDAENVYGADGVAYEPTEARSLVETAKVVSSCTGAEVSEILSNRAMVLYQPPYSPPHEIFHELLRRAFDRISRLPSPITDTDEERSWSSHSTERVFLSSIDGELFVVNPNQLLYKVRIIDETASDFDSIASPTKGDPWAITEADKVTGLGSHCEDDDLSQKRNAASEYDEIDMLNFDGFDSSEELQDQDPFLTFSSFGAIYQNLVSHTRLPSRHEECEGGLQESVYKQSDTGFGFGSAMDQAETRTPLEVEEELAVECPSVDPLVELEDANGACQATTTLKYPNIAVEGTSNHANDWVRELAHTMLGTESLFTFLNELQVEGTGKVKKSALTTAFLRLVDYERRKLGEALLPHSCTSTTILGSRILPHTTILGATSLAKFLSEIDIGLNEEISVVGVYKAFKSCSSAERRAYEIATTGIMGELGRAIGKLT